MLILVFLPFLSHQEALTQKQGGIIKYITRTEHPCSNIGQVSPASDCGMSRQDGGIHSNLKKLDITYFTCIAFKML